MVNGISQLFQWANQGLLQVYSEENSSSDQEKTLGLALKKYKKIVEDSPWLGKANDSSREVLKFFGNVGIIYLLDPLAREALRIAPSDSWWDQGKAWTLKSMEKAEETWDSFSWKGKTLIGGAAAYLTLPFTLPLIILNPATPIYVAGFGSTAGIATVGGSFFLGPLGCNSEKKEAAIREPQNSYLSNFALLGMDEGQNLYYSLDNSKQQLILTEAISGKETLFYDLTHGSGGEGLDFSITEFASTRDGRLWELHLSYQKSSGKKVEEKIRFGVTSFDQNKSTTTIADTISKKLDAAGFKKIFSQGNTDYYQVSVDFPFAPSQSFLAKVQEKKLLAFYGSLDPDRYVTGLQPEKPLKLEKTKPDPESKPSLVIMSNDATTLELSFRDALFLKKISFKRELTPKELGIDQHEITTSEQGFKYGGLNQTNTIKKLTKLSKRSIESLEYDMQKSGFLGEEEKLIDTLVKDNIYVLKQGYTHQLLALPLEYAKAYADMGYEGDFYIKGEKFTLKTIKTQGTKESPFGDGSYASKNIVVSNSRGESMTFSELMPPMIRHYGFYEGKSSSYRLEPAEIIKVFGPAIEKIKATSSP
ncbi:MAG: hypothetical protein KDK66_03400 [Deltaproteobacteria bacterium]|nr:hypothetical protein [Deltaproteobacteria bacterium]